MAVTLLLSVLKIAALVYAGMLLLVLFRQSRFVYYPDRRVELTPRALGLAFEEVEIPVGAAGERLHAWFVPARPDAHTGVTALFCHGNGGDIGDLLGAVATFHRLGVDALLFDYRGYGRSSGARPSEAATYADARAAWDWLVGVRGMPPGRIVLFGRSLGGAVAAHLAARVPAGGLVIESSFTSAPDMSAQMFPYLPVRWLCRFRYDTRGALARVACPVLIAHGREDGMIPFRHGERLFAAAREPKRFVELIGRHNDGGLDIDPSFQAAFREFVESIARVSAVHPVPASEGGPRTPGGGAGQRTGSPANGVSSSSGVPERPSPRGVGVWRLNRRGAVL